MKNTLLVAITLVSIVLAGCRSKPDELVSTASASLREGSVMDQIHQSQVIAYMTLETNNLPTSEFIVREIWRGKREASVLGITNGMSLAFRLPWNEDPLPDGAIMFIPEGVDRSDVSDPPNPEDLGPKWVKSLHAVYGGKVGAMSLEEFEAMCGT